MSLRAIRTVAKAQNGVGAFVLQCKRLDFHYCDWSGSSRGMNEFLQKRLRAFASENPGIHITVSPRPNKHPMIKGSFVNGKERAICVRNCTPHEVLDKATILRNASGEKVKRVNKKVFSANESVRGIWDPFHGKQYQI